MLSIFTASTGPRALTGSPVNGSSSGPFGGVGAGVVEGAGRAGVVLAPDVQPATANDAPTAVRPSPTAAVNCRRVTWPIYWRSKASRNG